MSRRANDPAGESPLGAWGSGSRSGAGPLPAEGTQLGSTVVPPVEVGGVPPDDWVPVGVPVGVVVLVPPLPAAAPPFAAWADAGAISRRAMRAATARRMTPVS